MKSIAEFKEFYLSELKNDVLPFWLKHGVDRVNGGYYTCVDRKGELFNTEKSVWFQGRFLYILSKALNTYGPDKEIREAADLGFSFIKKCFLPDGRMPFTVTEDGKPIIVRRYYFSETFAAISLAEYYGFTKNPEALFLARDTYALIRKLYKGEVKTAPKMNPDVIKAKAFAVPMILLNVAGIMREHDAERAVGYTADIDEYLADIDDCIHPECKCCFENVGLHGERLAGPRGRLVNPGHSIEASWFMMNEAEYRHDDALMKKALTLFDWSFALGWDRKDKGMQYFVDIEGKPLEQLEWDMRLWWTHCEVLIASVKAYRITGDAGYFDIFNEVHDYAFSHFKDTEYGEWYGYLRRDGSVNNELKGSMFKGSFHIPRCMILVAEELEKIQEKR